MLSLLVLALPLTSSLFISGPPCRMRQHVARAACAPLLCEAVSEAGAEAGAETGRKGRGTLWKRVRRRVGSSKQAEDASVLDSISPMVEGVSEEIELAVAERRRRLDKKLRSSLEAFKHEVLEEVDQQTAEAKQRQERLAERRDQARVSFRPAGDARTPAHPQPAAEPRRAPPLQITESLNGLQDDILLEVESVISGVKRGSKALDSALRGLRSAWEAEVRAGRDHAPPSPACWQATS